MRILIGCREVCGWIDIYARELKRKGHEVVTISDEYPFDKNIRYDYKTSSLVFSYIESWTKVKWIDKILVFLYVKLFVLIRMFSGNLDRFLLPRIKRRLIKWPELFICVTESFDQDSGDLKSFRNRNVPIITIFAGSEARYYKAFEQEFNISVSNIDFANNQKFEEVLNRVRMHERYSSFIFSLPDQSTLFLRPYYHLQIPIEIEKYGFVKKNNRTPKLVHFPSSTDIKGTKTILNALQELRDEGLDFELITKSRIPHAEVVEYLRMADILVDEIVLHGPGVLSFEAMACGCCVATRYLEDSPSCFRPPIVSINESNIKVKLRELITDRTLREKLAMEGFEYVKENNNAKKIIDEMISLLSSPTSPHYQPTYFNLKFQPLKKSDVSIINKYNDFVREAIWYKENVKRTTREEMIF